MKYLLVGLLVATTFASAEAKGGKGVIPIQPQYDYSREKAPGYKKDYCEDSVGNHINCTGASDTRTGRFSATYR